MSYIVFARKWRPLTFEDLVAQDHVSRTLQNAVTSKRIAHSYLFCGPRGVGKTSTARILAKTLNCENPQGANPCNQCTSCLEISDGRCLDVLEIDGASNRGIDEVRDLRENVRYVPLKGTYKIYIIDEVHMLTAPAFNALLKTLEEPPAQVLFIFATTEPHQVPATILSRCQRFDFKRIPLKIIKQRLMDMCVSENITIDDDAALAIAKKADGALRDAQSILDQIVSFSGTTITHEHVRSVLGLVDMDIFFQITEAFIQQDAKSGLTLARHVLESGYDFSEFFAGLLEHLRNYLVLRITANPNMLDVSENFQAQYAETVSQFNQSDILRLIQYIINCDTTVKKSHYPALAFESAIVALVSMGKSVELNELLHKLDTISAASDERVRSSQEVPHQTSLLNDITQKKKSEIHTPHLNVKTKNPPNISEPILPSAQQSSTSNAVPLQLTDISTQWNSFIDKLKSNRPVWSFLKNSTPQSLHGQVLVIAVLSNNGGDMISFLQNQSAAIQSELTKFFHAHIQCKFVQETIPEQTASPQAPDSPSVTDAALEEIIRQDPLVQEIITEFSGRIIRIDPADE